MFSFLKEQNRFLDHHAVLCMFLYVLHLSDFELVSDFCEIWYEKLLEATWILYYFVAWISNKNFTVTINVVLIVIAF